VCFVIILTNSHVHIATKELVWKIKSWRDRETQGYFISLVPVWRSSHNCSNKTASPLERGKYLLWFHESHSVTVVKRKFHSDLQVLWSWWTKLNESVWWTRLPLRYLLSSTRGSYWKSLNCSNCKWSSSSFCYIRTVSSTLDNFQWRFERVKLHESFWNTLYINIYI
jgi:hypothetical protein